MVKLIKYASNSIFTKIPIWRGVIPNLVRIHTSALPSILKGYWPSIPEVLEFLWCGIGVGPNPLMHVDPIVHLQFNLGKTLHSAVHSCRALLRLTPIISDSTQVETLQRLMHACSQKRWKSCTKVHVGFKNSGIQNIFIPGLQFIFEATIQWSPLTWSTCTKKPLWVEKSHSKP